MKLIHVNVSSSKSPVIYGGVGRDGKVAGCESAYMGSIPIHHPRCLLKRYTMKKCPNCLKKLDIKDYRQKFCSRSCSATFYNKARGFPRPHKKCANCQKEIKRSEHRSKRSYCSNKCQFEHLTIERVNSGRASIKACRRFLKKFQTYECSQCHISSWNDKSLVLQVDHINGDKHNSLPNNLRWLCPNCHSQTETWGNKARTG